MSRIFPGGVSLKAAVKALLDAQPAEQGWANYTDGTHTVGSPQVLAAGVRTQWTNDAQTALEDFRPNGSPLWAGDTIHPAAVGAAYALRIDFTIHPASPNAIMDLDLDIGSDPFGADSNIIVQRTRSLLKGSAAQFVSLGFPIYCLDTFFANKGSIGIECSEIANVYDKRITLVQIAAGGK